MLGNWYSDSGLIVPAPNPIEWERHELWCAIPAGNLFADEPSAKFDLPKSKLRIWPFEWDMQYSRPFRLSTCVSQTGDTRTGPQNGEIFVVRVQHLVFPSTGQESGYHIRQTGWELQRYKYFRIRSSFAMISPTHLNVNDRRVPGFWWGEANVNRYATSPVKLINN